MRISPLPRLASALAHKGCELRGDKASQLLHSAIKPAADNDYFTEHLAPILNIRIVENIDAALTHIAHYGSGHTDSIVTEDKTAATRFLRDVDSAITTPPPNLPMAGNLALAQKLELPQAAFMRAAP